MAASGINFYARQPDRVESLNAITAFAELWSAEAQVLAGSEMSWLSGEQMTWRDNTPVLTPPEVPTKLEYGAISGNFSAGGNRMFNAANAVAGQDYVTLSQINALILSGGDPYFIELTNLQPGSAIGDQFIRVNSGGDGLEGVTFEMQKSVVVTAISRNAAVAEHVEVTADGTTQTLPSSPSVGDEVVIGVGNFLNTVVARNGNNIMGLAEDLTLNKAYTTRTFRYINASIGWKVLSGRGFQVSL